jgi:hypothetical protein
MQPSGELVAGGNSGGANTAALARAIGGEMSITVTPNADLTRAGQNVSVTGSGFEPSGSVFIDQCRLNGSQCVGQASAPTNASGSFSTTINVDDTLDGNATSCADPGCLIRVGPSGTGYSQLIKTPISFSRRTSLELTPSVGTIGQGGSTITGQPITLSAFIAGATGITNPTGTVDYYSCGPVQTPVTCSPLAGTFQGTKSVSASGANDGVAVSDPISFGTPGRYCFRAIYNGDANYGKSSDDSPVKCVNVRQPNAALMATEDFYFTPNNADLIIDTTRGLIANDIYPSGQIIGANCTDPSHLCAVIDQNPLHGGLTLNPDGSFTYNPDDGYSGADNFTYILQQAGGGQSLPQTVNINVSASSDVLDGTRFRGTRFRGTRFREIEQVSMVLYSQCRSRFVWVNPQITVPLVDTIQVTAALYDAAGARIAETDGYLVNDTFFGDPFQPVILSWPVWSTPAPPDGTFVEVFILVNPGTIDEYEVRGGVQCVT